MQDYERLINHFFEHFNITFKVPVIEKKTVLSTEGFSISYCLKKEPVSSVVKFFFLENDLMLKSTIIFQDHNQMKFGSSDIYDKINIGLKCIDYLNRKKIKNFSNIIKITAEMDKTQLINFTSFSNTILMYISLVKTARFEIIDKVEDLVNIDLEQLNIDSNNINLNDKLDLLGMICI